MTTRRAVTQAEKDLVIEYANTGRSAQEAKVAIGRSIGMIYHIAKQCGVAFNGGHRKVGPAPSTIKMAAAPVERCPFDDIGDMEDDLIERCPQTSEKKPDTCVFLKQQYKHIDLAGDRLRVSLNQSGEDWEISFSIGDILLDSKDKALQCLQQLMFECQEALDVIDKEVKANV